MNSILGVLSGRNGLERKAQGLLRYALEQSPAYYRRFCTEVVGRALLHQVGEETEESDLRFDLRLGPSGDQVAIELKCWAWFTRNQVADLRSPATRIGVVVVPSARQAVVREEFPSLRVLSWDDVVAWSVDTSAELVLRGLPRFIDFGRLADADELVEDMTRFAKSGASDTAGHAYGFLCHLAAELHARLGSTFQQNDRWSIAASGGRHGWPYYGYYAMIVGPEGSEIRSWIGLYCSPTDGSTYLALQILGDGARSRSVREAVGTSDGEVIFWESASGQPLVVHDLAAEVERTVCDAVLALG